MEKYKAIYTILLISLSALIFSRCLNNNVQEKDVRGEQYAGSEACIRCHNDITTSYGYTAHHKTSSAIHDSALMKLYTVSSDTFSFSNEFVVVQKKQDSFFQSLYQYGKLIRTHHFDVAFGSGEKAQTFAYWKDKQLYQLPLSFFHAIPGWANSPGFPAYTAHFNRAIVSRCFECHGSYIEKDFEQTGSLSVKENLNQTSVIYGIDCERCHGPAARHVIFHSDNPSEKEAKYIVKWADLSRQQKLDACAVCHSGNDLATQKTTFLFQPGDTLSNFYIAAFTSSTPVPDVHGKQMQLLAVSACFQNSKTMDCTSCHNTHKTEGANLALFSQRCMNCHQPAGNHFCKLANTVGPAITQNCIDCHMPDRASKTITFQKAGEDKTTAYYLRTHKIAVYPEETNNGIDKLNSAAKEFLKTSQKQRTQ